MWHSIIVAILFLMTSTRGGYYSPNKEKPIIGRSKVIKTTHGHVQGRLEKVPTRSGRPVMVDVYWSIPFAKPPVGDLRFKRPVSADPWPGVLDVSEPPNSCMQVLSDNPFFVPNPSTPVSEDCLYLTIWKPRCLPSGSSGSSRYAGWQRGRRRRDEKNLATMIWLYGGGYTTGSTTTSWYNGALLAASQCVIVASINYRLGAFGFLFLDLPEVPGDMGLLDMVLASRWIKENIVHFGGDSSRITVFGNSAGGASTSLFLLSPLTRNLFTRAIIQSGSSINYLALAQSRDSAIETAREFSKSLACFSPNDSAIARCLLQVDPFQLAQEQLALSQDYRHFMTSLVDNYFLTGDPLELFQKGNFKRCELLLGSTTSEGTYFMGLKWPNEYSFSLEQTTNISDEELNSKLNQFFSDFLKPEYIPKIIADVKAIYQLDKLRQEDTDAHLTFLNYVIGDIINTCPVRHMAGFFSNSSQNVFLYSYNHAYDKPVLPRWVGAIHGSELEFVFGRASLDDMAFTDREGQLSQAVMTYWANFAKHGTPNGQTCRLPRWPTYHWPDPSNVLEFTSSANIRKGKTEDIRCSYWNNLPREYRK